MENKYITVLDFEVGRVFQYKIDILKEKVSDSDTYVRYLGDKGHNLTNCEWMVHSEKHNLTQDWWDEQSQTKYNCYWII